MTQQSTKTGLFLLAFISAVLNYAGFSQIIDPDNWWLKAVCLLAAIAVWVSLYLFWSHVFSIIPQLKHSEKRMGGWVTILAGSIMIVALSTYWNLIAFTGSEALRLSQTGSVTRAEQLYARTISNTGSLSSIHSQLKGLSSTAFDLARSEEKSGAITGSRGKGGVTQLLKQIGGKVDKVADAVGKTSQDIARLKRDGQSCLSRMRKAVAPGASSGNLGSGADCLNGVMASLGTQNIGEAIRQDMTSLTAALVLPVSIRSKKQKAAVRNILGGLQRQADAIANNAASIKSATPKPLQIERPNMAVAVLLHWKSIVPSIATALAIDLLPLILLILKVIAKRDNEKSRSSRASRVMETQADYSKTPNHEPPLIGVIQAQPLAPAAPPAPTHLQLTYDPASAEPGDDDWWNVDESEGRT